MIRTDGLPQFLLREQKKNQVLALFSNGSDYAEKKPHNCVFYWHSNLMENMHHIIIIVYSVLPPMARKISVKYSARNRNMGWRTALLRVTVDCIMVETFVRNRSYHSFQSSIIFLLSFLVRWNHWSILQSGRTMNSKIRPSLHNDTRFVNKQ